MSLADKLAEKKRLREAEEAKGQELVCNTPSSIPLAKEAEPIQEHSIPSIKDRLWNYAQKENQEYAKVLLHRRIKYIYSNQLFAEGYEVKAIDLVDPEAYPSGYIPVDAIQAKQKEMDAILAERKKQEAVEHKVAVSPETLEKTKNLMAKLAAAKLFNKEVPTERKDNESREEQKAPASKDVEVKQNGLDVQGESLSSSKQDSLQAPESSPIQQAEASFDARDLIAKAIEAEKPKLSFAEMMALKKKTQEDAALAQEPPFVLDSSAKESPLAITTNWDLVEEKGKELAIEEYQGAFALNIPLNSKQLAAKEMALTGKTYCLIGAAGTGKTTTQRSVAESLLQDKRLTTTQFKIPGTRNYVPAPSIAFVAYTRRASANLQRAIHKNPELEEALKHNVMTIHALLEFEPVTFWDEEKQKESMRFEPQRNARNPLTITNLVIEEASMLGLDLWEQLYDALPLGVQIIFIGDINQLPPVFGASILNYALVQCPVVELTQVYRQKGDSLVLANAHHILKGEELEEGTGFTIVRGKSQTKVGQERMSMSLGAMFKQYYDLGFYDPEQDIILSPFNKQALGTDNMNKWIAQFLGEKRDAVVFEVIAGFNKIYVAEGDKVMYNKQDAYVTAIKHNPMYHGKEPQMPGKDLSRFGIRVLKDGAGASNDLDDLILNYENFSIEELAETTGERKMQCSHVVSIETEVGQKIDLTAAGDFAPAVFSLGYVLTVHKAQGCEWRKVFGILHQDHSVMLFRELFYTLVTRAREEVIMIAKDFILEKAIKNQRIKGNSLEDKIEYFNSGALDIGSVNCFK